MKKVVVIAVIIILVVIGYCIYRIYTSSNLTENTQNKEATIVEQEEIVENTSNITEEEIKEITIYDIEEGYLTVDYNPKANKHKYDWDKYLDNTTSLYKYEDDKYISKLGIDVSEHKGHINWERVKKAGIEFAIIRLGYRGYGKSGRLVLDEYFEEYYQNAIANGIEVGVYFFSQSINIDEAREEAEFVLSNIQGKNITYPVVYDLERIKGATARTDYLVPEEITNMTMEFCKTIEGNGYAPCIYGNSKTFTTRMSLEQFNNYTKWYADYLKQPLYPYEFSIWQYTESGSIDGVEGMVDVDICFVKK